MREAIGRALLSSHLETEEWESAIDRIGALAHATKLGRLIYHWKYAQQGRFAGPVLSELTAKAGYRLRISTGHRDRKVLVRACKQAMQEFYGPNCVKCTGAGEFIEGNLKLTCQECLGSGKRRYPDEERVRALGVDWEAYKHWDAKVNRIIGMLSGPDSWAATECRHQLERNT